MKKIVVAGVLVILLGAYAWWDSSSATIVNSPMSSGSNANSSGSETTNPNLGTGSTPSGSGATGTTAGAGIYKDGTYKGTVANAFYGNLQVVATVQGGKITNISYPVYPNDRPETRQINNEALPMLKQEAIAAQSSNIDIVSGATQTSEAFQQSLHSALVQAQG